MAINVLTETPEAIGAALAPADADTIAEIVRHHRAQMREDANSFKELLAEAARRDAEWQLRKPMRTD